MKRNPGGVAGVLVVLVLGVAGCSGLTSGKAAEQIYVLQPAAAGAGAMAAAAPVPGVLRIARPEVQPGLDSSRIALLRPGNELDYFAGSRWGESLPKVLAALVVESLSRSNAFQTVVGGPPSAVIGDHELLLTARHFEARYTTAGGAPEAHVAFDCVLVAGAPRQIVGRCDAEAVEAAGDNRMAAIISALERAAQQALADVATRAAALVRK